MSGGQVHARTVAHAAGGHVGWVTVDHSDKLNIVGRDLCAALKEAVDGLSADDDLRALVLTGAGDRAFIGGADIREMVKLEPETARTFITGLHEVCAALDACPVPVIGRIQGYCLGAGLEVAAACDMRVASDDAKFGMPEVAVGLPSVIEAALLPRLVGWGKAQELVYTGRMIDASEALACGLIERVAPAAELDDVLAEWVDSICSAGPRAIRAQKVLIRQWRDRPLDQAIQAGVDIFEKTFETDEPQRYMRKFLDRK